MEANVHPSAITGTYMPPASKSDMQRACAAALLHKGKTILRNPGRSEDDAVALRIIDVLGAGVEDHGSWIGITSSEGMPSYPHQPSINCGESGLSLRMFTPIVALIAAQVPVEIDGRGSLTKRPMHFFNEVLPQLDVQVWMEGGRIPFSVQGPLVPKDISIDGSLSSQYLTGLLMAYGASHSEGVTIHVSNLKSKPYVDLTLTVMEHFGLNVPHHNNYEAFVFGPDKRTKEPTTVEYSVEGDWSGAAFGLVAGALAGKLEVGGLDVFSEQADKKILQVLMQAGIPLSVREDGITVGQCAAPRAFHFDATDCPDLFPPLVALAAYCDGTSVIEGVSRLAHKESNRGLTLQEEFGKLGLPVELQDDLMVIRGGGPILGGAVSSRHDHRIAMALAVAALRAEGPVTITDAEAVGKSYPQFWQHLQQMGANVSLTGQSNA
ncbi:MAG: 3-phosphoshikimate 1-carboxyvinyltransferase [Chitinophagaceae bacterium]|nr:MAG: 3-phosphoshikimate 1-carboxyvinyltransferase [Chitinophagaceae bacterium]